MGEEVAAIASLRSAEVAGSAYCSDRRGLVVFIKPGSDQAEQDLLAVAALYPDQTLEFQYVTRSADEMDDLVAEVVAAGLAELGLSGIGPDIDSGGLLVEAQGYGEKAAAPAEQLITEFVVIRTHSSVTTKCTSAPRPNSNSGSPTGRRSRVYCLSPACIDCSNSVFNSMVATGGR
ncbi:MAG: hypothetical protein LBG60_04585 [Bifidobacteriaceae bacterium]|jgi:hypothetical protein|nr:hypothetical protein [Bifidobacteriaceae bacterium]